MRLSEVIQKLEAEEIISPGNSNNVEIKSVCACDLLSDILATDKEDFIILTGLTTPQVVRTAEIVGAFAIIVARGKSPSQKFIGIAQAHDMPVYITKLPMFESCVRLKDIIEGTEVS